MRPIQTGRGFPCTDLEAPVSFSLGTDFPSKGDKACRSETLSGLPLHLFPLLHPSLSCSLRNPNIVHFSLPLLPLPSLPPPASGSFSLELTCNSHTCVMQVSTSPSPSSAFLMQSFIPYSLADTDKANPHCLIKYEGFALFLSTSVWV